MPNLDQYRLRPLTDSDIEAYKALRLIALAQHPQAFGETVEHFRAKSIATIITKLHDIAQLGGFILGAFSAHENLVGMVGLTREDSEKAKHRARIWGMYVAPEARSLGLGRKLLEECLLQVSTIADLEQVHITVVTSNVAAVSLYKSCGFTIYGEDPAALKFGRERFNEYLMVKTVQR